MLTKNTVILLEHGCMYDYGKGLQAKLTLGELIKALEKYDKSKRSSNPGEYLGDFLESETINTEPYNDPTAQCMYIGFSLLGQKLDVTLHPDDRIEDIRDKNLFCFYLDDRDVLTDLEEVKSLEAYKKFKETFKARYILEILKSALWCYGDIIDKKILGKTISVGKGDFYQNPEEYNPKNKIEKSFWIEYNSEWLRVVDEKLKSNQEILSYLESAETEEELYELVMKII